MREWWILSYKELDFYKTEWGKKAGTQQLIINNQLKVLKAHNLKSKRILTNYKKSRKITT